MYVQNMYIHILYIHTHTHVYEYSLALRATRKDHARDTQDVCNDFTGRISPYTEF